jgi:hypothetical protein
MSRLVEPIPSPKGFFKKQTTGGEYAERIMKYIPGEVLSGYVAINGILASVTGDQDDLRRWAYILTFLLCATVTPVYFWLLAKPGQPKRRQMVMSTLAFIVWAYNLGGVFKDIYPAYVPVQIHIPWIGSILIIAFTLVSGLFAPSVGDK